MIWLNRLINWAPYLTTGFILVGTFYREIKGKNSLKTTLGAIGVVLGLILVQMAAKILYIFLQLRNNPLGQYLLSDKSSYLMQVAWQMAEPFLWTLLVSLGAVLLFLLIKVLRPAALDQTDLAVVGLTTLAVYAPANVIILLLVGLLSMVIWSLLCRLPGRVALAPFLLFWATLILVLANFRFYGAVLSFLRLS